MPVYRTNRQKKNRSASVLDVVQELVKKNRQRRLKTANCGSPAITPPAAIPGKRIFGHCVWALFYYGFAKLISFFRKIVFIIPVQVS